MPSRPPCSARPSRSGCSKMTRRPAPRARACSRAFRSADSASPRISPDRCCFSPRAPRISTPGTSSMPMAATPRAKAVLRTAPIAVVGAGLMGHGIAQVFAQAGHLVHVHDPIPAVLASVHERIARNLRDLGEDLSALRRVMVYAELAPAVAEASVVFEAGPEDLSLKQQIFTQIEAAAPADALLASNTSVIPITAIMQNLQRGERALGTHWWNPPYLVPL